jgi:hypothetical protein
VRLLKAKNSKATHRILLRQGSVANPPGGQSVRVQVLPAPEITLLYRFLIFNGDARAWFEDDMTSLDEEVADVSMIAKIIGLTLR